MNQTLDRVCKEVQPLIQAGWEYLGGARWSHQLLGQIGVNLTKALEIEKQRGQETVVNLKVERPFSLPIIVVEDKQSDKIFHEIYLNGVRVATVEERGSNSFGETSYKVDRLYNGRSRDEKDQSWVTEATSNYATNINHVVRSVIQSLVGTVIFPNPITGEIIYGDCWKKPSK